MFSLLFETYYRDLVLYAASVLSTKEVAEDIVQSLFVKLWEDRVSLRIETSLKSYLVRSVRNAAIDYLRHQERRMEHYEYVLASNRVSTNDAEDTILYSELSEHLDRALEKLPPLQREVFEMFKMKGYKQKEIAEKTGVSLRTVEERIAKAVSAVRINLRDFIAIFF